MNLKRALIFILSIIMIFPSAACSKPKQTPEETANTLATEETHNETVDLTPESKKIIVWFWDTEPANLFDAFASAYPDYELDNTTKAQSMWVEDKSLDLAKLAGAIASNEQPDLFHGAMTPIEAYYSNLFMPIQNYFDADADFQLDDFDTMAFDGTTFNDQIYFAPFNYTSYLFAWNKDIYEKVGLDPNTPPKTWDEFMDFAKRAVSANTNGKLITIGTQALPWDTWHMAYTGEHYVDKTGLDFNWNTPTIVESLELSRSVQDIYGGKEKLGSDWWWFLFNNVAMGTWSGSIYTVVEFDFDLSRVPLPEEGREYYSAGSIESFLGIPKKALNPKGGWLFLKYAMTDGIIAREQYRYELHPTDYSSEYIIHKPTREKYYSVYESILEEPFIDRMKKRDQLLEEVNRTFYASPVQRDLDKYMSEKYELLLNYELAPQDFVIQMQEYSEALIKEFKEQKEGEGWTFTEEGGIPPVEE